MEDFSHFLITLFFTLYFSLNVKWANLIISKRIAERRKNGCKKISLHQYNDETHAPCCYNYPCRLKLNLDFYSIDWSCRLEGASQSCTEEWFWPNTEDRRSSFMKNFRIPKTEDLRSSKISEYRRPKIFVHEKFPKTEDRRSSFMKNFRIPKTKYLPSLKISE